LTAVRANEVEATLRRLDPRLLVILVYGPDTGLVAERAKRVAESGVTDPNDPFQLVRLDGDTVAGDPARLLDEAGTVALFGGQRMVWVRPTNRNIAPAVEPVLALEPGSARVVIEAGDLAKTSPLRVLCERSARALALPCYADEGRDLGTVVDETLRGAGLTIGREARQALLAGLGGDRLATRNELAKLLLYVHGRNEVTLDDIDQALSDVSALASDAAVDAAFSGDMAAADQALRRSFAEGAAPGSVLAGALRHALTLLPYRAQVERGERLDEVMRGWRGLHFRRQDAVRRHLATWNTLSLRALVGRLQEAVLATRRQADMAEAIASRALIDVAARAAARSRERA
jgi:DNA polymerase-3 subunit delta